MGWGALCRGRGIEQEGRWRKTQTFFVFHIILLLCHENFYHNNRYIEVFNVSVCLFFFSLKNFILAFVIG